MSERSIYIQEICVVLIYHLAKIYSLYGVRSVYDPVYQSSFVVVLLLAEG